MNFNWFYILKATGVWSGAGSDTNGLPGWPSNTLFAFPSLYFSRAPINFSFLIMLLSRIISIWIQLYLQSFFSISFDKLDLHFGVLKWPLQSGCPGLHGLLWSLIHHLAFIRRCHTYPLNILETHLIPHNTHYPWFCHHAHHTLVTFSEQCNMPLS